LSATGTSRKPKWVVPGLFVCSLMRGLSHRHRTGAAVVL